MEHRAAQMNFAECGIVLFLSTFLPFSIGSFLIYSLICLFILPNISTESLKMFQMLFLGTLFFYFVREHAKKDKEIDGWINIIAALFLVNIFWVILQASGRTVYFSLKPEFINSGLIVGFPGIMGQRVFQGILCAVAAPILLKKSFWFAPLILIGLYFSESTTAVAAALGGLFFLYPKKTALIIPLILLSLWFIKKDMNFTQFSVIYQKTLPLIKDPWLGQGIGSFHNAMVVVESAKLWWREAHNEYYQLYFEFGIAGVFIFVLFLLDVLSRFLRNRKDHVTVILCACFFAFLISCLGQPVMHVVRIAMVGITVAALIYARSDQLKGT